MTARKTLVSARKPTPTGTKDAEPTYEARWATAVESKNSLKTRIAALTSLGWNIVESRDKMRAVLAVVRDVQQPRDLRLAALAVVQSATFAPSRFAPFRPDYLSTLRMVARGADAEMRQRALGFLAREHDAHTQEALIAGLENPEQALVAPEKALQLLSYDVHAEAYRVARAIVRNPPNADARREALRLLAADAVSAPTFEKLLKDKMESFDIRQLAASALNQLAPHRLQACARDITLDDAEPADIKSVSLTALSNFGDATAIGKDDALHAYTDNLGQARGGSAGLKRAAKNFAAQHKR